MTATSPSSWPFNQHGQPVGNQGEYRERQQDFDAGAALCDQLLAILVDRWRNVEISVYGHSSHQVFVLPSYDSHPDGTPRGCIGATLLEALQAAVKQGDDAAQV